MSTPITYRYYVARKHVNVSYENEVVIGNGLATLDFHKSTLEDVCMCGWTTPPNEEHLTLKAPTVQEV
jgi:hypothetical protein